MQQLLGPNDGCRIFYFSLPPTVYTSVSQLINETCRAKKYENILMNSKKFFK
jgi:glucose-6-phosphate 1-dehydrogenase